MSGDIRCADLIVSDVLSCRSLKVRTEIGSRPTEREPRSSGSSTSPRKTSTSTTESTSTTPVPYPSSSVSTWTNISPENGIDSLACAVLLGLPNLQDRYLSRGRLSSPYGCDRELPEGKRRNQGHGEAGYGMSLLLSSAPFYHSLPFPCEG
jgi:hypothetical protein